MHMIRSLGAALAGSVLFVLLLAMLAVAQASGSQMPTEPYEHSYFDYTFGRNGVATVPITGYGLQVRQLDTGKVLVWNMQYVNNDSSKYVYELIQLNADGTLDANFGTSGVLKMTTDPALAYGPSSFVVQSDGKIIAYYDRKTLVRYTRDGITDTTYGLNGAVTISVWNNGFIGDMRGLQAGNKLLLSLQNYEHDGGFTLYRRNMDGTLDASFGISGTVSQYDAHLSAIAALPDGSLVLGYETTYRYSPSLCKLEHYSRDGQSLGAFTSTTELCFEGLQQPDGKLLVISYTNFHPVAVSRLNVDGSIDTTFGTSGTAQMDPLPRIVQHDGTMLGLTQTVVPTETLVPNFAVVRYQPNGKMDTTFADQGQLTVPIAHVPPYNTLSFPYDIAPGRNNTILVSGVYDSGFLEHVQYPYVVRIRNTPIALYRAYLPSTVLRQ